MSAPAASQPKSVSRRVAWVTGFVLVAGLAFTLVASRLTGPTFDEERRLAAVKRATDLVRGVVDYGPMAIGSSSAQAIYEELEPFGALPALVSGWFGEVLAQARMLDRLVAARLGWLLVTGLAPVAVFLIAVRGQGMRVALLAACLLLAIPRWTHPAAAAQEPAILASIWLLVIAFYVQSLTPSLAARRAGRSSPYRAAAVACAVAVGLGLSTSLATLWVLPGIVIHATLLGLRDGEHVLLRGRLRLPSAVLWIVVLSPLVLLGVTPSLWKGGGAHTASWLLSPLAPAVEPLLYRGAPVVSPRDVPGGYALRWVASTTPVVLVFLSLVGAGFLVAEFIAERRRGRFEPTGVGLLLLIAAVAVLLGPALTPTVLTRFPPRVEAVLPFVAIAAAVALDRLAGRWLAPRFAAVGAALPALLLLVAGNIGISTASAAFGALAGGERRAADGRQWTLGDGSELAALAPAIDKLGMPRLTIDAPDVPRGYWALLERDGRLRTHVDSGRGQYGLSIRRGDNDRAVARVMRGGAVLWSLCKR